MPDKANFSINILKKRAEFLRAASQGKRIVTTSFIMQVLLSESDSGVRVGFTATKKLGGAVVRNRVKRRLKAAIRELLPQSNAPGGDYVFIARKELETCAYDILLRDMRYALKNTHKAKKDTRS